MFLFFILQYLLSSCSAIERNENATQPDSRNTTDVFNINEDTEYYESVRSWCWWIIPPILLLTGTVGNTLAYLVMRRYAIHLTQDVNKSGKNFQMRKIRFFSLPIHENLIQCDLTS